MPHSRRVAVLLSQCSQYHQHHELAPPWEWPQQQNCGQRATKGQGAQEQPWSGESMRDGSGQQDTGRHWAQVGAQELGGAGYRQTLGRVGPEQDLDHLHHSQDDAAGADAYGPPVMLSLQVQNGPEEDRDHLYHH
uniref:Uncharacterized protein n=1 Tax=Melopsittacus undulatus TaxID=13146 RepID=A0A8V5GHU7_MELUD